MKVEQENVVVEIPVIKFETRQRMLVFYALTATNILINMDHGTIPAATNEIKRDYVLNNSELGSFGSFVYLGSFIGALFLTRVIDVFNRKTLTIFTTILEALLIYSFTKISEYWFLLLNRILVGVCQSYVTVYFPVWIDQFGPRKWKTVMMAVFNITSPLGVMLGYILTMLVKLGLNVS